MPLVAALRALSAATGWASGISEDPPRATSLLAVTSTQGGGAVAALRPLVAVVLIASPTPPAALLAELLEAFEGLQGELRGDVLPDQGFAVDAAEEARHIGGPPSSTALRRQAGKDGVRDGCAMAIVFAAAALELQSFLDGGTDQWTVEQLLQKLFMPVLESYLPAVRAIQSQMIPALLEMLTEAHAWDLLCLLFSNATLVLTSQQWTSGQGRSSWDPNGLEGILGGITLHVKTSALLHALSRMPVQTCVYLVAAMLDWPLPKDEDFQRQGSSAQASAGKGLHRNWAQLDLYMDTATCKYLLCKSADFLHSSDKVTRQLSLQTLLPSLVRRMHNMPAQYPVRDMLIETCSSCWSLCRSLLERSGWARQAGLAWLIQAASLWVSLAEQDQEWFPPRHTMDLEPKFQELMLMCARDRDSVIRKQTLYVLEQAIGARWQEKHWSALSKLMCGLEAFPLHLVEPVWIHLDVLHPPLGASPSASLMPGVEDPLWGYEWVEAVWAQGLSHKNPQVARLVAKSLFSRQWDGTWAGRVSDGFLVEVVTPALVAPVHHKEGAGEGTSAALESLKQFTHNHIASRKLPLAAILPLLHDLVPISNTRSGLAVAMAVAESACAAIKQMIESGDVPAGSPAISLDAGLVALSKLVALICSQPGSSFRARHFRAALASAAAICWEANTSDSATTFSLQAAAQLLSHFPPADLALGTPLRDIALEWLVPLPGSSGHAKRSWLELSLTRMLKRYTIAQRGSSISPSLDSPGGDTQTLNPRNLKIWKQQSQHWALLVRMLGDAKGLNSVMAELFQTLDNSSRAACERSYQEPGVIERVLMILTSMVTKDDSDTVSPTPKTEKIMTRRVRWMAATAAGSVSALVRSYGHFYWTGAPGGTFSKDGLPFLEGEAWEQETRASLSIQAAAALHLHLSTKVDDHPDIAAAVQSLRSCMEDWLSRFAAEELPRDSVHGPTWPCVQLHALEAASGMFCGLSAVKMQPKLLKEVGSAVLRELRVRKEYLRALGLPPGPLGAKWTQLERLLLLGSRLGQSGHSGTNMLDITRVAQARGCVMLEAMPEAQQAEILVEALADIKAVGPRDLVTLLKMLQCLLVSVLTNPKVAEAALPVLPEQLPSVAQPDEDTAAGAVLRHCAAAVVAVLGGLKRKRVAVQAAAVGALLPHAAFQPETHDHEALHRPGGAVPWTVEQLMGLPRSPPGLLYCLALQLGAACAARPSLAATYTPFFCSLLLQGAPDAELEGLATHAGAALLGEQERQRLQSPLDPELDSLYACTAMGPRVAVLCYLRRLAENRTAADPQHAAAAHFAGHSIWRGLIRMTTDPELSSGQYRVGGGLHRRKVRLWQALCCASVFVEGEEEACEVLRLVLAELREFNLANVRQYQEVLAVALVCAAPSLLAAEVLPLLEDYEHRHEGLASYVLITAQAAGQWRCADTRSAVAGRCLAGILPWAMSHNHNLRTFTQVVMRMLLERFPQLASPPDTGADPLAASARAALAQAQTFLQTNHDIVRLCNALAPAMYSFDVTDAADPRSILCKNVQLIGPESNEVNVFEGAPVPLFEEVTRFLNQERNLRRSAHHERVAMCQMERSAPEPAQGSTSTAPIQRKATPVTASGQWVAGQHVDATLLSASRALGSNAEVDGPGSSGERAMALAGKRQHIVVVASLIDKVPNLAGLTRTCEVFRASSLVVADRRALKDPAFANISVSAEHWVPIEEVSEQALQAWLLNKREAGYCLIGLEQTNESVSLPTYPFPAHCVLLLGREKEGIPVGLLGLLDTCVEIPQLGVIRSLNVHVSGAIAVYEYTRQQRERLANGAPPPPQ